MNAGLPEVKSFLASLFDANATTSLAHAVAWLNPLCIDDVDTDIDLRDHSVLFGLRVCQDLFPATYKKAMIAHWQGLSETALDELITDGVNRHLYYELEGCDGMPFGVPMNPRGVEFYNPDDEDFADSYPELVEVLEWLGGNFEDGEVSVELAESVGMELSQDLYKYGREGEHWRVFCLLCYLFNQTGSEMADMSRQYMAECGCYEIPWTKDGIAQANRLNKEADTVIEMALSGLELITVNKKWERAFRKNAKKVLNRDLSTAHKKIARGGKAHAKRNYDFTWP